MRYQFQSFLPQNVNFRAIIKTRRSSTRLDHHDFHPHYEIYYCRQSVPQDIIINGQSLSLCIPCIIFSAPFSIHGISLHDETTLSFERTTVYFDDAFLKGFTDDVLPKSLLLDTPNCIYPLTDEQNKTMSLLFDMLFDASEYGAECHAYFAAIVNTLDRLVPAEARITAENPTYYVIDVLKFIYENKASLLNSEVISRRFHVSRAKLDRDFRKFVGRSVHETVIDCRLDHAMKLLKSSDMRIGEIASECGFEGDYYFYAFFKRNTGTTPLQFRKTNSTNRT